VNEMQFYLRQQGILIQDDETIDDSDNDDMAFPLHSDLEVYEKINQSVCFTTSVVTLSNGSNLTIEEVISYYHNLM
jgi:hypothetical protein